MMIPDQLRGCHARTSPQLTLVQASAVLFALNQYDSKSFPDN